MLQYKQDNSAHQIKTIEKLEARIANLNKAIAALPPLCECLTIDRVAAKQAQAEKLCDIWEQDFHEELRTGIRASIDWMDPSKRKSANGQ